MRHVSHNLHTSAGSPTDTLLRLLHRREAQFRLSRIAPTSTEPHFVATTGGVYKKRGRILRALMTRGY